MLDYSHQWQIVYRWETDRCLISIQRYCSHRHCTDVSTTYERFVELYLSIILSTISTFMWGKDQGDGMGTIGYGGLILGHNWDKRHKSFLLAIHSHLYYGFYSPRSPLLSKSWLKLFCNVNIVYGNLKSENTQDCAQKPQRNCTFMNSASELSSQVWFEWWHVVEYKHYNTRSRS